MPYWPRTQRKNPKGEFVDLDKLLPRDRIAALHGYSDDSRMEWVQRDGSMYLVPAKKDTWINNFRRWEQAFRLYASIYCEPGRYGNISQWFKLQLLHLFGKMCTHMTSLFVNLCNSTLTEAGQSHITKFGTSLCMNLYLRISIREDCPAVKTIMGIKAMENQKGRNLIIAGILTRV